MTLYDNHLHIINPATTPPALAAGAFDGVNKMSCCQFCGNIIDEARNDCGGKGDPSGCHDEAYPDCPTGPDTRAGGELAAQAELPVVQWREVLENENH